MKALTAAINGLDWTNTKILVLCKFLTIVLVGAIAVDVFVGVFWRYVLNDALAWYEESSKFLMLWMVFTASPIVLKQGGLIALDVLPRHLPPRLARFNYLVIYTVVIGLLGVLVYHGFGLATNAWVQKPTSIPISYFFIYLAIPFGCAIMALISIEFWLRSLRGIFDPRPDDFPNTDWTTDSISSS
jgi:TRAP-type C4-dicarboxylate transport system permease small subunit